MDETSTGLRCNVAGGEDDRFGERGRWGVEGVVVLGPDELGTCLYDEFSHYRLVRALL